MQDGAGKQQPNWRCRMAGSENVKISYALFKKIMQFFDLLSLSGHVFPSSYGVDEIWAELDAKRKRINLRALYSDAVYAKNADQRRSAIANYQRLKYKK
jgi:hypothetical protein